MLIGASFGFIISSFPYALNSYFKNRRSKATGISMTLTGLGPVFYAPLVTWLHTMYDANGTILLVAAIAAHSLCASCLLQPIKWHMIDEPLEIEENKPNDGEPITQFNKHESPRKL